MIKESPEQEQQEQALELGEPDLSSFIDDEPQEITLADVDGEIPKAKKGLKPSFAVKKFMPMAFAVMAKAKGEHWLLANEETEDFAEAVDECMEHYFPDNNTLPPWAMLAISGFSIAVPRIMVDFMSDDEKAELKKQMENLPDETAPTS